MANEEHLALLKQGFLAWNEWRHNNHGVKVDLSKVCLSWADFSERNLTGADLRGADLRRANFKGANLNGANLCKANLTRADLSWTDLNGADLNAADLTGADLSAADLIGTDLSGAILFNAVFCLTNIISIDLGCTLGLEEAVHVGPSTIDIDTIFKSHCKIPTAFLRGVGVPENFIDYMPSLVGKGIEFYSCFISYSTANQEFADRLHADLQAKGVRCWLASHDIKAGEKIHEQIDSAIRLHEKTLLVLSRESMASSWVKTEIFKTRKLEISNKTRKLFPLTIAPFKEVKDWSLFYGDEGRDLAEEIREYFIPDFSKWKDHDAYQEAFERLLKDLKAGQKAQT